MRRGRLTAAAAVPYRPVTTPRYGDAPMVADLARAAESSILVALVLLVDRIALPDGVPAQLGCLGRHLVVVLCPWGRWGRAVALDRTVLRAAGGVGHPKDRAAGLVPHTSIDTEAHWTTSGWPGWGYGWELHLA